MQVIAIDLGSNTLQAIKYDCVEKKVIKSFLKTVRTAEGLIASGKISKEATARVVDALLEAKEQLNFSNCKIEAVTTQALRVATNTKDVLNSIKEQTGVEFNIISPKIEAELTLKAVKARLDALDIMQNFVLCDIGGGSTEISYYIDGKIYSKSFELGIVTTANSTKSLEDIEHYVKEKALDIKEFIKNFNNSNLIFTATAGTPTTIAAMKLGMSYNTYDAAKVTGTNLSVQELNFYLDKLLNMSISERKIAVGVGRDDLIVAGVIIFKEIYSILNKNIALIIDDGLSIGVGLNAC